MIINLGRVVAFLLAVTGFILLVKFWPSIKYFLSSIGNLGPGSSPADKTEGLFALLVIGLLIVALVKILTHQSQSNGNRNS